MNYLTNTDISTKVIYYSPEVAGFHLGVSYSPRDTDDGGLEDFLEAGLAYTGSLGEVDALIFDLRENGGGLAERHREQHEHRAGWAVSRECAAVPVQSSAPARSARGTRRGSGDPASTAECLWNGALALFWALARSSK